MLGLPVCNALFHSAAFWLAILHYSQRHIAQELLHIVDL